MSENRETEVKLYVPDLRAKEEHLCQLGALRIRARTHEYNLRFDHPALELANKRTVLRLRQDHEVTLTYKDDAQLEDGIISRFEAEVRVSDFEKTKGILEKLGFTVTANYEKYRTTFALAGTEIVLDELPYGNFLEIEGSTGKIQQVLEVLGLLRAPRLGYSYLQLFLFARDWAKKERGLAIHSFSFEAFAGLRIPKEAFLMGLGKWQPE